MAYISLAQIKEHLNIESTFDGDDSYLTSLIDVAELSVSDYCNTGLSGYTSSDIPVTVKQATLLLAAHFYVNRTMVSYAQGTEIPYSFKFLLNPYRKYTIK